MGDQMRFSPNGARFLDGQQDFREDKQCKVTLNADSDQIRTPANFEPLMSMEERQELLQLLDKRGGTQRNKPRAHDPAKNPLGGRIFDMTCSWAMYRQPYLDSFRYTCGLYQQSHGQQCEHNHVDGPLAAKFMLSCLRQRLLAPSLYPKLKARLRELAADDRRQSQRNEASASNRTDLERVRRELKMSERNLALATSPENFQAIEAFIADLRKREKALAAEQAATEMRPETTSNEESEVEAALAFADRLAELVSDAENFALADAKLFVRFQPVQKKRRTLNQMTGGVVTLGAAPPPVALYEGPTSRDKIKQSNPGAAQAIPEDGGRRSPTELEPNGSGREGTSLGNVSRGDRI
jgi:hypothetical protein